MERKIFCKQVEIILTHLNSDQIIKIRINGVLYNICCVYTWHTSSNWTTYLFPQPMFSENWDSYMTTLFSIFCGTILHYDCIDVYFTLLNKEYLVFHSLIRSYCVKHSSNIQLFSALLTALLSLKLVPFSARTFPWQVYQYWHLQHLGVSSGIQDSTSQLPTVAFEA